MNELTQEEIELMDKVFALEYKHRGGMTSQGIMEALGIDLSQLEYVQQEIAKCIESNRLGLCKIERYNSGNVTLFNFDNYRIDKFLNAGGFTAFYENLSI